MLARLAEDLYWAGRYLERLQHSARVLDVTTETAFTSPSVDEAEIWQRALATLMLESTFRDAHRTIDGAMVASYCVIDTSHSGSLASLIRALRENVRRVRELVPSELWEAVNDLYLRFDAANVRRDLDEHPAELYAFVKGAAHAVVGVATETMSRDDAARFFELGIHIERAGTTTRVLGTYAAALDGLGRAGLEAWAPVLRICAARETFVRSGRPADVDGVVNLLMFSPLFPRSVRFSVVTAADHVRMLIADGERAEVLTGAELQPLVARRLGLLRGRLDFGDVGEVLSAGLAPTAASLEVQLRDVNLAIAARFFHHAPGRELRVQEIRAFEQEPSAAP
jgi:uncharacterized alpha-E superfamily protein